MAFTTCYPENQPSQLREVLVTALLTKYASIRSLLKKAPGAANVARFKMVCLVAAGAQKGVAQQLLGYGNGLRRQLLSDCRSIEKLSQGSTNI